MSALDFGSYLINFFIFYLHLFNLSSQFVFDLMVLGKMNSNKSIEEFVLVSHAPVETAVKLSKHFRVLATKEKERARDILLAGEYMQGLPILYYWNQVAATWTNS